MTLEHIAGICFCIVFTSEAAGGQPPSEVTAQGQKAPARTVMERTYATSDLRPWRRVETRSESGTREVLVDTLEVPNIEGRLTPAQEIVTETNRTAPNITQTRRDVFGFSPDGRRRLVEVTDTQREISANGDSREIHNTSAPDLNGRASVTSRQIVETRSAAAGVRDIHSTLLVPDLNEALRATERTEYTERLSNPGQVRYESTQLIRDINGRWQSIGARHGEAREIGASERMEEETIQRRDINGNLVVEERNLTRRSNANDKEQVVIETYALYADGTSRLALSQRVHRTTTATADGGRHTVEEMESRSQSSPNDPMRVTRRTVTTVRQIAADRRVTERQVFERDVNGQLRLVINDTEERVGR
jgi:hypothetical protein